MCDEPVKMDSSSLHILEIPQLIWFAVALGATLIGIGVYRRWRPSVHTGRARSTGADVTYSDAPTVRVLDSQHFDRLRKPVHLTPGDHVDILPAHPVIGPRFRIILNGISVDGSHEAAHITVVYGGLHVSCGPLVKELGYNEFLVPRAGRDEARSSVLYYRESGHSLEFMRLKVNAIERNTRTVEIEVVQMRGRWPW